MAMGGADANLGIDSEVGIDAERRCRNSKWTKNSASVSYTAAVAGGGPCSAPRNPPTNSAESATPGA